MSSNKDSRVLRLFGLLKESCDIREMRIFKRIKNTCIHFARLLDEKSVVDILFDQHIQWSCKCSIAKQEAYQNLQIKFQLMYDECKKITESQTASSPDLFKLFSDQFRLCRLMYDSSWAMTSFAVVKYVHRIAFKSSAILHQAGHTHTHFYCPYDFLDSVEFEY